MVRRDNVRLFRVTVFAAFVALGLALPAAAQTLVSGTVKDVKGTPLENALVVFEPVAGGRKTEKRTNAKGEFVQAGMQIGAYNIIVTKEGYDPGRAEKIAVRSKTPPLAFVLGVTATALEEGAKLSAAGDFDGAIAKYNESLSVNAKCAPCYYNIGVAQTAKKDYPKAEEAYKKAIELEPTAEAYNGLIRALTMQRKVDEAAEASKKAAELTASIPGGAADPEAQYNQAVVLWNAGKVADAKVLFEQVIAAKPDHAEAHYQLGMALVNEGNLKGAGTEFQTYLTLAPNGPNAAQAKALAAQLPK